MSAYNFNNKSSPFDGNEQQKQEEQQLGNTNQQLRSTTYTVNNNNHVTELYSPASDHGERDDDDVVVVNAGAAAENMYTRARNQPQPQPEPQSNMNTLASQSNKVKRKKKRNDNNSKENSSNNSDNTSNVDIVSFDDSVVVSSEVRKKADTKVKGTSSVTPLSNKRYTNDKNNNNDNINKQEDDKSNKSTDEVRMLVESLAKKKKKVKKPTELERLPRVHPTSNANNTDTKIIDDNGEVSNVTRVASEDAPVVPELAHILPEAKQEEPYIDGLDILQHLTRPSSNKVKLSNNNTNTSPSKATATTVTGISNEEVINQTENYDENSNIEEHLNKGNDLFVTGDNSSSIDNKKSKTKKGKKKRNNEVATHLSESPSISPERLQTSQSTRDTTPQARHRKNKIHVHKQPTPELLLPLSVNKTRPVELYFVDFSETPVNLRSSGAYTGAAQSAAIAPRTVISATAQQEQEEQALQPMNEEEMLLEQFAEYTDDDSFFSSSEQVIPVNARRHVHDPLRQRATRDVHDTLELQDLTARYRHTIRGAPSNMSDTYYGTGQLQYVDELWMYQIHHRGIALEHSSLYVFPPRWGPRVVLYNIMHHWVAEMIIFLSIIGYSIFQASWARYSAPRNHMTKPDFMLWADVFYTVMLGLECMIRIFTSGLALHERAFFRSPWHWLDVATLIMMILTCTWEQRLWNFTAWRLLRCIKCLTYVPLPTRMKLLAKSLLRSTNQLFYVSMVALYFIFFFGLLGLQLFNGGLRHRCYNVLREQFTTQLCRPSSSGRYWFYWGLTCERGYECREVHDRHNENPHFNFRSFDDVGHAMLAAFQIMTFQGWTSLYTETSAGVAVMAILYYVFTILILAWIIAPLYLAVFLEKMEYTSRLFMLKQLDLFDHMLTEQKQRMCRLVRIRDYVCRDARGHVPHYPVYHTKYDNTTTLTSVKNKETLEGKGNTEGALESTTNEKNTNNKNTNKKNKKKSRLHARGVQELLTILSTARSKHGASSSSEVPRSYSAPSYSSMRRSLWSDEKRIQLQLSLTRQVTVAEVAERRRLKSKLAANNGKVIRTDDSVSGNVPTFRHKKLFSANSVVVGGGSSGGSSNSRGNVNNSSSGQSSPMLYKVSRSSSVHRSLSVPQSRPPSSLKQSPKTITTTTAASSSEFEELQNHNGNLISINQREPSVLSRRYSNASEEGEANVNNSTNKVKFRSKEVSQEQVTEQQQHLKKEKDEVDFALGGRVGVVQHHYRSADIGSSQQSDLPFAVRQELEAEQIRFLQPSHSNIDGPKSTQDNAGTTTTTTTNNNTDLLYTSQEIQGAVSSSQTTPQRGVSPSRGISNNNNNNNKSNSTGHGGQTSQSIERANTLYTRPPRVPTSSMSVVALRESIGVVPHSRPVIPTRTQTPPSQRSQPNAPTPPLPNVRSTINTTTTTTTSTKSATELHTNDEHKEGAQIEVCNTTIGENQMTPLAVQHSASSVSTPRCHSLPASIEQSQQQEKKEDKQHEEENNEDDNEDDNDDDRYSYRNAHSKMNNELVTTEIIVNDPEGGDFKYAQTIGQRWSIVRNILHMFLLGYPRVLTLYLFEYALLRRRYGLMPLTYTNRYEEAALNKLRARRRRARARAEQQLASHQAHVYAATLGNNKANELPRSSSSLGGSSATSNGYGRYSKRGKAYEMAIPGQVDKSKHENHYFMYYNDRESNDSDTSSTAYDREQELLNAEEMYQYDFPYSDERKLIYDNGNNSYGYESNETDTYNSHGAIVQRNNMNSIMMRESAHVNGYDGISNSYNSNNSNSSSGGLYAGTLSPIRMARNIVENAPPTLFARVMYILILCNVVFNAARYSNQPDNWEAALFYLSVILSALFTLEQLSRLLALGVGPFFFDVFNVIEFVAIICSLFQLGFSRSNAISLFQVIRLLRWFRVMPGCPLLRHVTRVLIRGIPEIMYGLVMFTLYMFMWLLIGMSFFGSRVNWISHDNVSASSVYNYVDYSANTQGWYYTRINFETFSQAAFAIAQAFSVNRDEWLYASWDGMRVRGGYTVMYFIGTVIMAYVVRYLFIALWIYKWQGAEQPEEGDNYAYIYGNDFANYYARQHAFFKQKIANRLPWFDFTVWRSFKHIHGGFARRDVAPDEVYQLNEDMRRELRLVEVKDRLDRATKSVNYIPRDGVGAIDASANIADREENNIGIVNGINTQVSSQEEYFLRNADEPLVMQSEATNVIPAVQYVNINGQLYRRAETTMQDVERQRQLLLAAAASGEHVVVQNEKGEYEILITSSDDESDDEEVNQMHDGQRHDREKEQGHPITTTTTAGVWAAGTTPEMKEEEGSVYYYNGLPIQMPFANRAQLRFARRVHTIPATTYATTLSETEQMLQERQLMLLRIMSNNSHNNNKETGATSHAILESGTSVTESPLDAPKRESRENTKIHTSVYDDSMQVNASQGYSQPSMINPVFAYRHTLSARENVNGSANNALPSNHASYSQRSAAMPPKHLQSIAHGPRERNNNNNNNNDNVYANQNVYASTTNDEGSVSIRTRLTKLKAAPTHHLAMMHNGNVPVRTGAKFTHRRIIEKQQEQRNGYNNHDNTNSNHYHVLNNSTSSSSSSPLEMQSLESSSSLLPEYYNEFNNSNLEEVQVNDEEETETTFEHVLLPGPKLQYKSVIEPVSRRRVFEVCINCNTHKQLPLKAPRYVLQRSANALHKEHCHMAAVRASKQLVLNALIGYVNYQITHHMKLTKYKVELILGQAWSCGMLLFETLENLTNVDLNDNFAIDYNNNNNNNNYNSNSNTNRVGDANNGGCDDVDDNNVKSWQRVQEALAVQQWLLGLHIGEEQVGRATLAYTLAHQQLHEARTQERRFATSWTEYSLMAFAPSHPIRQFLTTLIESPWFELFMLFIIFAASVCLAIYTPEKGNIDMGGTYTGTKYKVLHVFDDIFTVIFVIEMVMKWIALGVVLPIKRAYFWHLWNIFDCFIVLVSLISWGSSHVFLRYLKVLRCFRLIGSLRFWRIATTLNDVSSAIWNAIPTLANVCLIMLVHYIIWAIIFCSMFMNKMSMCSNTTITSRESCESAHFVWHAIPRNFDNFYESLLTTFEMSTGAEWSALLFSAGDAWSTSESLHVNRHPYKGLVFIAYFYLSHFILFSLLIAGMICAYFATKRSALGHIGLNLETEIWLRMQRMLLKLRPKVQLLPRNPSSELIVQLHKFVSSKWFEFTMGVLILLNAFIMSLQWYDMSSQQERGLRVLQYIFVALFTVEIVLRLYVHGKRAFSKGCFWVDVVITILSYIQIGLNTTSSHQVPFNVNVLRLLRVGRVFTVLQMAMPFTMFLTIFVKIIKSSVPALISIGVIHVLCTYIFAIVGLHVFGYVVPYHNGGYYNSTFNNFSTFVNALIMTFRLSTLENWATMLRGSLDRGNYCNSSNGRCGPTNWAPLYYIAIFLCYHAIIFPLYMAVILEHFMVALRLRRTFGKLREIHTFIALWSKYDANAELVLPTEILPILLEELRPPLGITTRSNRVELLQVLQEYNIPDHDGQVSYHEVLGALTRRITISTLQETNTLDAFAAMLNMDDIFNSNVNTNSNNNNNKQTVINPSLIPAYVNELEGGNYDNARHLFASSYSSASSASFYTTAHFFAASYLQACYRRNKCMRAYFVRMNVLWQEGRQRCVEQHLSCDKFGFGGRGLAEEDPATTGRKRGYYIPSSSSKLAIMTNAILQTSYGQMESMYFPIYNRKRNKSIKQQLHKEKEQPLENQGVDTEIRSTKDGNASTNHNKRPRKSRSDKVTSVLPAMYQPVIATSNSKFGPNAPDAIRRYEKRSAKLQRKYAGDGAYEANTSNKMSDYLHDRNIEITHEQEQISSQVKSPEGRGVSGLNMNEDNSMSHRRRSPARTTVYQPPLGADPELLRQSAIKRVQQQQEQIDLQIPLDQSTFAETENNDSNIVDIVDNVEVKVAKDNYKHNQAIGRNDTFSPSPVRESSTSQRITESPLPSRS